jgi:hypothetical protein
MLRIFAVLVFLSTASATADELGDYLRANGKPPVDYVLSKVDAYPIVILGENHWMRHDAELVKTLVPQLHERGVALAMETLPAELQAKIDALVCAPEWDVAVATEIMRVAEWPYVQYREILHAVWKANRAAADAPPMKVIALGPPEDWREKGIRYDEFMAQLVIDYTGNADRHVLAYTGMHHAFTRYMQVERRKGEHATEFMTRFGNILWRRYGQNVFLIALHKTEWCGPLDNATSVSCPPFNGAIDCAASSLGHAVAFDITGSPIAEMKFPGTSFYAIAHPYLRFYDYADGYIWSVDPDHTIGADLIPLAEYAPEDAADATSIAAWDKRAAQLAHPYQRPGYEQVLKWRSKCVSR